MEQMIASWSMVMVNGPMIAGLSLVLELTRSWARWIAEPPRRATAGVAPARKRRETCEPVNSDGRFSPGFARRRLRRACELGFRRASSAARNRMATRCNAASSSSTGAARGGVGVVGVEARAEGPRGGGGGTTTPARDPPENVRRRAGARRAPRDRRRCASGGARRPPRDGRRRRGAPAPRGRVRGARRLARHRRRRPRAARGGPRRREEEAVPASSAARRRLPHLGDGFAHGRLHLPEVAAVEPRPRRPRRGPPLRRPQLRVPQERELLGGAAEELMSAIRVVQDAVHPQKTRQSIAAQRYVSRQGHLVWALRRLRTCGLQHG